MPAVTSTSEITLLSSPAVHGQPVRGMALMREGVVVIACGSGKHASDAKPAHKTAVKTATIHQTLTQRSQKRPCVFAFACFAVVTGRRMVLPLAVVILRDAAHWKRKQSLRDLPTRVVVMVVVRV